MYHLYRFDFYILVFLALWLVPLAVYAQDGPGGIGGIDGTTNLVLWLDPHDIDGDGLTTDNPNNGDTIQTWHDKSGKKNDAVQTVLTHRATYDARGALSFDGNDDGYTFGSTDIPVADRDRTIFVVHKSNARSTASDQYSLSYGGSRFKNVLSIGARRRQLFVSVDTATGRVHKTVISNSLNHDDPAILSLVRIANTSVQSYYNGQTGASITSDISSTGNNGYWIGKNFNNQSWEGFISEVIIYNVALNEAQRVIIENYLSAKYNIPLGANDVYKMDGSANGDYDFNVAGIGRGTNISDTVKSARGSGVLTIRASSSFPNPNSYLMWGDNDSTFRLETIGDTAKRIWRVSENNADLGSVDMTFDLKNANPINDDGLPIELLISNSATFKDTDKYP